MRSQQPASKAAPSFTSTVMPLFPNTDCAPYFRMPASTVTPLRYDIGLAMTSVPGPSFTSLPEKTSLSEEARVSVLFSATLRRMLPVPSKVTPLEENAT